MSNTVSKVSDNIRNANKRAIEARDKWRKEYDWITKAIRTHKRLVAIDSRLGMTFGEHLNVTKETIMVLKALQERANILMLKRFDISWNLKHTAYKYA